MGHPGVQRPESLRPLIRIRALLGFFASLRMTAPQKRRKGNMAIYLTWLGHSTFKIETAEGKTFLIDPWITQNPLCPESEKRQTKVDVLLCTHGHGDHIGD